MIGHFLKINELSSAQVNNMYKLMCSHFDGVSPHKFKSDLDAKTGALLIEDKGKLVGFSTMLYRQEHTSAFIYSGDTIMDPSVWNSSAMARCWIKSVLNLHTDNTSLYWLLISSGIRTYRFLPTFWQRFYPHPEQESPFLKDKSAALALELFGRKYDPNTGLVVFDNPQVLRTHLRDVPARLARDPFVRFFETVNPKHYLGDELVCLTQISIDNLTPAGHRMVFGRSPPLHAPVMTQTCRWINRAWRWLGQRQQRTFERDLLRPKKVQAKLLFEIVQANCQTDFGKQHGFERIKSVDDYQRSVPLTQYDDYVGAIDRIRTGNRRVLTRDDVTRLVPTSGSTNAVKWIPMTKSQLASFKTLANLWMADIFTQQPEVMAGPAYWSISPAITMPDIASAVPLGFEDDAAYGGWLRPFIQRIWPVPSWIQHAGSDFQELTLLHLLQAHQLSLVSVWHPSFFSQLCEAMVSQWDHLMMILREGKTYHVHGRSVRVKNMAAAKRLGQRDPNQPQRIWPQLAHISCWADGHARGAAEHLHTLFPKSRLVPKGILATEACVSLPFQGCWPLALFGAFFEFMDEKDQVFLAHQLEEDKAYSLIITTRGGLYRYRMFDQVRVTGFLGQTPSIRFNGKTDHTSDLVGEKLNEAFVADAMRKAGLDDRSVLAPVLDPPHYRLLLGSPTHPDIGHHLDLLLSDNPYYAQARNQGQLKPLSVKHIDYHPQKRALSDAVASNRVRGGVKVLALAAPEPH